MYSLIGLKSRSTGEVIEFTIPGNVGDSLEVIHFSIASFTSIGSGNWTPVHTIGSILLGVESFLGAVLLALLVFILGRRTTW